MRSDFTRALNSPGASRALRWEVIVQELSDVVPAGPADGAAAGPAAVSDPFNMALSVTRHVQISEPSSWRHLVSGVDTLDLGVSVDWGPGWEKLRELLAKAKADAVGTSGKSCSELDGFCLVWPSGKPPLYAFHLQWSDAHIYLAQQQRPKSGPNAYISIAAKCLWQRGVTSAADVAIGHLTELGATVLGVMVSRVDFTVDFHVDGGLSLDLLRATLVTRASKTSHHCNGDRLETFYVGSAGAPLRLRVYDKSREVIVNSDKSWFYEVWQTDEVDQIWRVEFQLRRETLKQFEVNTLDDLAAKGGGLWSYLTEDWASLRRFDDANSTRRSVIGWWLAVQEVGRDLGPGMKLKRDTVRDAMAPIDWYVNHAAGCLVPVAVRRGITQHNHAIEYISRKIGERISEAEFSERYRHEQIRLGAVKGEDNVSK